MSSDPQRLEGWLRELSPASPGLDRNRLLYRMGRASAPSRWPWQLATLATLLLAFGFAVAWWNERGRDPLVVERSIVPEVPLSPPEPVPVPYPTVELLGNAWPELRGTQPRHLFLQEHLLRHGLDGLGQSRAPTAQPLTLDELLENLSITERDEP